MKKRFLSLSCLLICLMVMLSGCNQTKYVEISEAEMLDKVKGAWAAKMFGVEYGMPFEFKYNGQIYEGEIGWTPEMIVGSLNQDDIYGQLNFMMTLERLGLDAPIDSLAKNFANAGFPLCHANLQARKNYFDGIPAEELSYPENSIHAEDLDFQIEADFIGIINPVMPQSSNALAKRIGSIMGHADGLYGGMFIAAMDAFAYKYNDVEVIINEALKTIPAESTYAECLYDAINGYKQFPDDWRKTWQLLEDKWGANDICTPFDPFNIDAKINGAYIVVSLLYGKADFEKTMEIAVRCGQDTDCNSSNAVAVLGIMHGYDAIPEHFKSHIEEIADKHFLHTNYSFKKTIEQSIEFIRQNVIQNGGKVENGIFYIVEQEPVAAEMQKGFGDLRMSYFQQVRDIEKWRFDEKWDDFAYNIGGDNDPYKVANAPGATMEVDFEGTGVALLGSWNVDCGKTKVYIDGEFKKEIDTYYREEAGLYAGNRAYLYHITELPKGKHTLKVVVSDDKNPASAGHKVYIERIVVYK